jgi:hypothetical protein
MQVRLLCKFGDKLPGTIQELGDKIATTLISGKNATEVFQTDETKASSDRVSIEKKDTKPKKEKK